MTTANNPRCAWAKAPAARKSTKPRVHRFSWRTSSLPGVCLLLILLAFFLHRPHVLCVTDQIHTDRPSLRYYRPSILARIWSPSSDAS